MPGLSISEEVKIVAMLARGDTYEGISANAGFPVSTVTVGKVKKRNKDNLDLIAKKTLAKEEADAAAIKNKANKLISSRLDKADNHAKLIEKLEADYINGDLNYKEYYHARKTMKDTSLPELVIVSKEMHHQTSAETTPPANQQDIATLISAIKSGDEVKLNQIIFNGGQDDIGDSPITQLSPT